MAEWLTVADLRVHLELPEASVPEGSDIETRMSDALDAATDLVDSRTSTTWDDEAVLPAVIRAAGLLQAARLFKRQAATFGIATVGTIDGGRGESAFSGMRLLARLDPDVELLLADYADYSAL